MNIRQDLRYAVRMLVRSPGITLLAIVTLAVGIGANTAMFTVANAVLLRPLPYADPESLVMIGSSDFTHSGDWDRLSLPYLTVVRDRTKSLSGVGLFTAESFNLTGTGDPEQVDGARVSWDFFNVLGVSPLAGRGFREEEDRPGGSNVVILSHAFAVRLFGDPVRAVGQAITLDSTRHTVIGVLPPDQTFAMFFGRKRDIWAPRVFDLSLVSRARIAIGGTYFQAVGRLRRGVSAETARSELEVLYGQYRRANPGNFDSTLDMHIQVGNLQERLVADVRPAVLILSAAVGFILLIACANVAGLLLSRAAGRRKEFAIRAAMGAGRAVLVRQVLVESLLLGVLSGVLGVALGHEGTRALVAASRYNIETSDLAMDIRVLTFALALTVATAVLFGITPALHISKTDVNVDLREEGRGTTGSVRRVRGRNVLVVVQVALSMVLLVGSALLIQSFIRLRSTVLGFEPRGLLTMHIGLPPAKYTRGIQITQFANDAIRAVHQLPGVEAVAISTTLPVTPNHVTPMLFEGQPAVALGRRPIVNIQQITSDYAKVLRLPLLQGRSVSDSDTADAPKVAIVNQSAARRFWPNENAIGKKIWIGTRPEPFEVAGVFGDTRNNGLATPPVAEVFLPFAQLPAPYLELTIRAALDPHSLVSAIRRGIGAIDRDQPVTQVKTMDEVIEGLTSQRRFMLLMLGGFAGTALLLAITGIYGLISYSVAQRTQEMGVRIAMGATSTDIFRLIMGGVFKLTIAGIVIGIVGCFWLTRLLSGFMYETSVRDPIAIVTSALLFTFVAIAASFAPARRATRIDPTEALRAE